MWIFYDSIYGVPLSNKWNKHSSGLHSLILWQIKSFKMHQNDPSGSFLPSYPTLADVKEDGEETRVHKDITSTE